MSNPIQAVKTVLIVPAVTDQAGQCRIVQTGTFAKIRNPLADYRLNPHLWHEVGLMNFAGELVCYEGPDEESEHIRDCEPLAAGLVFVLEA